MIDIRKALEQGLLQLDKSNPESRLEVEILLCEVLKKNRAYLYAHPEQLINPCDLLLFNNYLKLRLQGMPIAYITGHREFWSLDLEVNQHTLIPRHETEKLIELALELMPNQAGTKVLDLGTGSGAIALALAKERPDWQIDACDQSFEALSVAKNNASLHGINNVTFYHSNWFEKIPRTTYQAIISNPPYIDPCDPHLNQGDLRFEPQSALVSSQEGFADLQYIIEQAYDWLLPNGLLLLEHGFQQKGRLAAILEKSGYMKIQCWQDMQGRDRVSGGWRLK